jgi:hypothetical protein
MIRPVVYSAGSCENASNAEHKLIVRQMQLSCEHNRMSIYYLS